MIRSLFVFLLLLESTVMADESLPPTATEDSSSVDATEPGGVRTMGGRQFWGDMCFYHGWRIQHNVVMGHYRLLDPQDKRHESGTLAECQAALKQFQDRKQLPPMKGKAVILIHGIGRSAKGFFGMTKALQKDGFTVVGLEYPSTRVSIQQSAQYLHNVIQSLEGIESIDLVCHSMGGLLLRAYLEKHGDDRLHHAVLLGVPNKGAEMADMLKKNPLFKAILGPAGQQLITDDAGYINRLPTPKFPFAVIAGGRSGPRGYNPLLPGDNDSTVTVESTRLPGAADFMLLPVIHTFLMNDSRTIKATQYFLNHGRLDPERPPEPITSDRAPAEKPVDASADQ